ncbi:MAG: hypothetical protein NVS4B3_04430 [Gemmatimonadaceae bacterium]
MHPAALVVTILSQLAVSSGLPAPSDSGRGPRRVEPTAVVATRVPRPPMIDGRGKDATWALAPVIDGFRGEDPVEDADPRFRTEARVTYDSHNIYVLVRAFDPHPDSIISLLSRRDQRTASDQIKVMLDSYHDRRTGYEFAVNPAGVKRDYYTYNDSEEDASWDAVWDVATRIDSLGWVAEFRIPLSQLRYAARPENTFGISIWRDIARYNERVAWPLFRRNTGGIASQFGELTHLVGLEAPRRLEATPYVVTRNMTQQQAGIYARKQDQVVGADIKYGLTSNLTVDATVNADFGQVEADPAVLNLTAFETFFDEKRPFFLEGTSIFRFDVGCNNGSCSGLFYSRRIGRAPQLGGVRQGEDGDAIIPPATRILGAAKLTGRLSSGTSIGFLDAVTAREVAVGPTIGADRTAEPQSNYFVGRLQQDFRNGASGLGVMVTGAERRLDRWSADYVRRRAYTAGVDGRHRFGGDNFELIGYAAGSTVGGSAAAIARTQVSSVHNFQRSDAGLGYDTTRTGLDGYSAKIGIRKIGGGVTRFSSEYQLITPGFEANDVGFLAQADMQSWSNWLQLQYNQPALFFLKARVNFNEWQQVTTGGLPTSLGGNFNAHVVFTNSWWAHFGITQNDPSFVSTYCDRCARGGAAIRNSPSWNTWAGLEGDQRKRISGAVFAQAGRMESGRGRWWSVDPGLDLRLSTRAQLHVAPSYNRNIDDLQFYGRYGAPGVDTTHYTFARLNQRTLALTTRTDLTFTPNLSLQLYAQPFVTSGQYSDWRELARPRAERYEDRLKPFSTTGGALSDFNFKQFRSNTVLRWEYRPGSTVYMVWTQGRTQDGINPGSFNAQRDYRDLFGAHPDNTFLVKASYWFSL